MTDDIVTRLRELIPLPLEFADESAPAHLISEAADEIERLRSELLLWKQTAKHVRYHHCKPVGCRYCAIYAEEYPNDPVVD